MPKIQEYQTETSGAGPVGGTSPNLEAVSMFGRGIEHFGQGVESGIETVYRRQAESEISDANAAAMNARAEFHARIADETDKGTLDLEKVKEDYQDYVDKQSEQYNTAAGKNTFNRMSARVGGSILREAGRGQAQIAGNNARTDLNTTMNQASNMIVADPMSFADIRAQVMDGFQSQLDQGNIPPAQKRILQTQLDQELSKSAVRGWAKQDYDAVKTATIAGNGGPIDLDAPQFNKAMKMLNSGGFDDFLDSDKKKALESEIMTQKRMGVMEGNRVLQQNQDDQKQAANEAIKKAMPLLINGKMPDDLIGKNSALDATQQMAVARFQEEHARRGDMVLADDIQRRIYDANAKDHIQDESELLPYASRLGSEFPKLIAELDKSPQGHQNNIFKKQLWDLANETLVNPKGLAGIKDPDGLNKKNQFMAIANSKIQAAAASGQDVSELINPTSPKYLGNLLQQFKSTPQEIIQKQAEQLRSGASLTPAAESTYQPSPRAQAVEQAQQQNVPKTGMLNEPGQTIQRVDLGKASLQTAQPLPSKTSTPPPNMSKEEFLNWMKKQGK